MPLKGPFDRIDELRATIASLKRDIAAGKSGDGLKTGRNLEAPLATAEQELRTLLSVPENKAKRMYPKMKQ